MNCKNCGKPLAPDVKFCGFCGITVEDQDDKTFKEKPKGINNTTKIAVLIMLLAFCILGVSLFIFVSKTQKPQVKDTVTTQTLSTKPVTTTLSQGIYQTDNTETESPNPPDPTQKNDSMNLAGTYWRLSFGPTNGGQYIARFEENGEILAWHCGSATFSTEKYSYSQNKLYIEIDNDMHNYANYYDKIRDDEFKTPKPVHISNGDMIFYYEVTRITDAQSIKEFEEKAKAWRNENTTTEEAYTEPQNNYSDVIINYDKYSKYFGKDKYAVLNDYPDLEEIPWDYEGAAYRLQLSNTVYMNYAAYDEICYTFDCSIEDLYPNIPSNGSYVTLENLEKHLGIKVNFTSDDPLDHCPMIYYTHNGYKVFVYCNEDGSIPNFKTTVRVGISD